MLKILGNEMEIGYVPSPDHLFDRVLFFIVANGAVKRFVPEPLQGNTENAGRKDGASAD